jgi:uncharacterized protein YbaR (Trm112 family)
MNVVSQDLLDILRCPNCVRDGPEAGLLDHAGNWLICRDCDRKYPIRDDIPVMLIEEGTRFQDVPRADLPEVPPPEERRALAGAGPAAQAVGDQQKLILAGIGLAIGIALTVLLMVLLQQKKGNE